MGKFEKHNRSGAAQPQPVKKTGSAGKKQGAFVSQPAKKKKKSAEDDKKKKISLGFRKAEDNPWEIFKRTYSVGDVVDLKITGFATYGAFAVMNDGTKGLIYISQIANRRIDTPQSVLSVGQEVKAVISEIDLERNRVNFSIRALLEAEEAEREAEAAEYLAENAEEAVEAEEVVEEAAEEVATEE